MIEISWMFFIGASLAVILAPGQDMVLVMSRGMSQGAAAGIATGAGVSVGLLCHTLLAALGLGALVAASELAYSLLKYVGAAYLVYLGLRMILSGVTRLNTQRSSQASLARLFYQGAFSNLSNPKIALFYFAFLPQFVPESAQNPTQVIFLLGVTFAVLTFIIKVPVGYFSGTLSNWFRRHPKALAWVYRSSGAVLIGLGARLAIEER
ncbi:LysE family translocator [Pelagibius sp. Alg239-R121]|uniref:LysE family translocator n=1 Tax=Pelagibius sp. Alg239-R121 TaxID=2993448 RepID=UPI0024A65F07|nr:LysE family translocator [Pelagibius sp. Alg239-R121]